MKFQQFKNFYAKVWGVEFMAQLSNFFPSAIDQLGSVCVRCNSCVVCKLRLVFVASYRSYYGDQLLQSGVMENNSISILVAVCFPYPKMIHLLSN